MALDKIFRLDVTDRNFPSFVLGESRYDPSKDTGYARLFTKPILKAWRKTQAKLAQADCGGKHKDGDICGFNFDPIICGQDYPDTFIYRTLHSSTNEAIITYTYPEYVARNDASANSGPTYRMIKENEHWKMDGAYCGKGENYNFNMPQDGYLLGGR